MIIKNIIILYIKYFVNKYSKISYMNMYQTWPKLKY